MLLGLSWSACSQARSPDPFPLDSSPSRPVQAPSLDPPYSVALLPFDNLSEKPRLAWLRLGFVEMLTTDLAAFPGLTVVSRQELGEVLREQWLQHRGLSPDVPAVRIGRLMGARYLLKGGYYVAQASLILEMHLIDGERGTIVRSARFEGSEDNIPELERRIAKHIGTWFETEGTTAETGRMDDFAPRHEDDEESFAVRNDRLDDAQGAAVTAPREIRPHVALPAMDSLLYLERVQRVREAAVLWADRVWDRGFHPTVMPVEYCRDAAEAGGDSIVPSICIPVIVQFEIDRLRGGGTWLAWNAPASGGRDHRLHLAWQGDDPGARTLFHARMIEPRRLFVRAKDASGAVVAVSSPWDWRMERYVHVTDAGSVIVPAGHIFSGRARFPVHLLSRNGEDLSFDAVIVRVPAERRAIKLEPVEAQDDRSEPPEETIAALMARLEAFLRERWKPVVWESLPRAGYLPGNRRSAVLLVSGTDGVVQAVRLLRRFPEVFLSQDLSRLRDELTGMCLAHRCPEANPSPEMRFAFRVQLELIKDIHALGLGGFAAAR